MSKIGLFIAHEMILSLNIFCSAFNLWYYCSGSLGSATAVPMQTKIYVSHVQEETFKTSEDKKKLRRTGCYPVNKVIV
jgi:hypothetical protein